MPKAPLQLLENPLVLFVGSVIVVHLTMQGTVDSIYGDFYRIFMPRYDCKQTTPLSGSKQGRKWGYLLSTSGLAILTIG